MGCTKKILSLFKKISKEEKEANDLFLRNGSVLLEELIAYSNGRYDTPICSYRAQEIVKATNNFIDPLHFSTYGYICKGTLRNRLVLVKMFKDPIDVPFQSDFDTLAGAVRDIAITSLINRHGNVLKIIGCCLEFTYPAIVYEYVEFQILDKFLTPNCEEPLSWKSRLKIINGIGNAIVYLHTAFPTPIIYRILNPRSVIIDQNGTPKLFDFTFAISLPPGELRVEDDLIWIPGYFDPEYHSSRFVTQKTDVYSFGVLLLVLLTGKGAINWDNEDDPMSIVTYVQDLIQKERFEQIVDPRISKDFEVNRGQLQAYLDIALGCVRAKGEDRPDMLDVARRILHLVKPVYIS